MDNNSQTNSPENSDLTLNPLATANERSLDELFDEDPEKLTQEDIGRIVGRLRAARASFLIQEQQGKKPKATTDKGKTIDLSDLGL